MKNKIALYYGYGTILNNITPYKTFFLKYFPETTIIETFDNLDKYDTLIVPDCNTNIIFYCNTSNLKKFIKQKKKLILLERGCYIISNKITLFYPVVDKFYTYIVSSNLNIINSSSNILFYKIINGKPITSSYPLLRNTPNRDKSYNSILTDKINITYDIDFNKPYEFIINDKEIILDDGTLAYYHSHLPLDINLGKIWKIHKTWAGYPVIMQRKNILLFIVNFLNSELVFYKILSNFMYDKT